METDGALDTTATSPGHDLLMQQDTGQVLDDTLEEDWVDEDDWDDLDDDDEIVDWGEDEFEDEDDNEDVD